MKFLSGFAKYIFEKHTPAFENIGIVFPNQRAGLFFRKEFAKNLKKPVWEPSIFSLEQFLEETSSKMIPDTLPLLAELFQIYKTFKETETFESFYTWGEQLIQDFEEIDSELVSVNHLFTNLKDLTEIEFQFPLDEEQVEALQAFWSQFSMNPLPVQQQNLLAFFSLLQEVYRLFHLKLQEKNWITYGTRIRELAESDEKPPFEKLYFAGFYYLSKGEQKFLKRWIEAGIAEVWFDTDDWYLQNPVHEAGLSFRNLRRKGFPVPSGNQNIRENEHHVTVHNISGKVSQAKAAAQLIESWTFQGEMMNERIALILPDSKLLFPLLSALPANIPAINITMGYPFQETPLFSLLSELQNIQLKSRILKNQVFVRVDSVKAILFHPWITVSDETEIQAFLRKAADSFLPEIVITELQKQFSDPVLQLLFRDIKNGIQLFELLNALTEILRKKMLTKTASNESKPETEAISGETDEEIPLFIPEMEFLFVFHQKISQLAEIWKRYSIQTDLSLTWKIILEVLYTTKIRFSGEPVTGIQIMGLLESRLLDFEKIIVLSMNEGSISGQAPRPSFIPHHLRKAFALPTLEETDSQIAYYFYRLLHHPTEIHFFYNASTDRGTGEPSRLLAQLAYEWKPVLQGKWIDESYLLAQPLSNPIPISLKTTETLLEKRKRWFATSPKAISATAISTFLNCKLQFALRYYSDIQSEPILEEQIQPGLFGKIVHKVLFELYLKRLKYQQKLETLKADEVSITTKSVFQQMFQQSSIYMSGKNFLLQKTIEAIVKKVVLSDQKQHTENKLAGLEKRISASLQTKWGTVQIQGVLDRIDKTVSGEIHIIDYKTGDVKKIEMSVYEQAFQASQSVSMQLLLYTWIWLQNYPEDKVKAGVYPLKKFDQGVRWVSPMPLIKTDLQTFEQTLVGIINEMLDPDQVFEQTDNDSICKNCEFRGICMR